MSDGMIEMSDEVEGIIQNMDGVAEDFPDEAPTIVGQRAGTSQLYVKALEESRVPYKKHFRDASVSLRKVVKIMREAAADQRKVESEIVDLLKRLEQDAEAPAAPQAQGKASSQPGSAKKPTPLGGEQ